MLEKRKLRTTPGVLFLLSAIPAIVLPPAIVYWSLLILARSEIRYELIKTYLQSPYMRVVATVGILRIYSSLKRVRRSILRRQDRKRLGSDVTETPRLKGAWPWNLDILRAGVKSRKTGMQHGLPFILGCSTPLNRVSWRAIS